MGLLIPLVIIVVELVAPTYIGLLAAILNFFMPDSIPYIDEIVGMVVMGKKLLSGGDN